MPYTDAFRQLQQERSVFGYHRLKMEHAHASKSSSLIENPDLTADAGARRAVKNETVAVVFADVDGKLASAVGINRYSRGDALITGSTGDRWSVSRDRFDAKYDPEFPTLRGEPGNYHNRPAVVLAKRMNHTFSVARSPGGDTLHGDAGDWLIEYAPGDFGIVDNVRFERVYQLI